MFADVLEWWMKLYSTEDFTIFLHAWDISLSNSEIFRIRKKSWKGLCFGEKGKLYMKDLVLEF